VYAGEHDEYYSFITPEAYSSLLDWIKFREEYGEKVTAESWLMKEKTKILHSLLKALFLLLLIYSVFHNTFQHVFSSLTRYS
jgi:hypothetical protein